MPLWYKVILTESDILAGNHTKLQNDFLTLFTAMKAPSQMAMFGDETEKEYSYYFAVPENLEDIAKVFLLTNSAKLSEPPRKSDASLLVGDADAFDLLTD